MTVLATATLQIFPNSKAAKGHLPASTTFDLPGGRADLWSYPPIKWEKVDGFLPKDALSESGRTFWVKSAQFKFKPANSTEGAQSFTWSKANGLKPDFVLNPALFGGKRTIKTKNQAVTKSLIFNWEGPDNKDLPGHQVILMFPIKTEKPEKVFLKSSLPFDKSGNLQLVPREYSVSVSALDELVEGVVYPPEFFPTAAGAQELTLRNSSRPGGREPKGNSKQEKFQEKNH